jgi:hypothetical protein
MSSIAYQQISSAASSPAYAFGTAARFPAARPMPAHRKKDAAPRRAAPDRTDVTRRKQLATLLAKKTDYSWLTAWDKQSSEQCTPGRPSTAGSTTFGASSRWQSGTCGASPGPIYYCADPYNGSVVARLESSSTVRLLIVRHSFSELLCSDTYFEVLLCLLNRFAGKSSRATVMRKNKDGRYSSGFLFDEERDALRADTPSPQKYDLSRPLCRSVAISSSRYI